MAKNVRELAFKALKEIFEEKGYSNIVMNKYSRGLDGREKSLLRELVYGTLENSIYYEWLISKFSKIKIRKIDSDVRLIMKTAVHQIIGLDKIPDSAAVNEAVKLTGKHSNRGAKGFVNGVLRNISRNKENLPELDKSDEVKYLSVKYSYQDWMIKMWLEDYGFDFTEALCIANNGRHYMNIRVNTLKAPAEEVKELLKAEGYEYEISEYSDLSFRILNPSGLLESRIYTEGMIDIQDITSIIAVEALNPKAGEAVIDMCAAPGGKTAHMAACMENEGRVSARDIYEFKLEQISEKAKRLGADIIETMVQDSAVCREEDCGKWDRCLVDAPCSALGLIRNKPEIKLFRGEADMEEFPSLQMKILSCASRYLKAGGELVYSTCSINRRENEGLIKRFLNENEDFELIGFDSDIKKSGITEQAKTGQIQFFPNINDTNGFFVAKLKKH